MDKKDEFNLDEFKDLLNDVPDAGDFDLESIIAEALPKPRPSLRTASRYTASLPLPPQSRRASSRR